MATCKCSHADIRHVPNHPSPCRVIGCECKRFEMDFDVMKIRTNFGNNGKGFEE